MYDSSSSSEWQRTKKTTFGSIRNIMTESLHLSHLDKFFIIYLSLLSTLTLRIIVKYQIFNKNLTFSYSLSLFGSYLTIRMFCCCNASNQQSCPMLSLVKFSTNYQINTKYCQLSNKFNKYKRTDSRRKI